jgi:signal transduction histidine kinase
MPRASRVSLRWKLVAALLLTSAATLAADDAALIPSVQRHLEGDRLADLARVVRVADVALSDVPRADLRPRSHELRDVAGHIANAASGRMALFDASGRVLAAAAEHVPTPEPPLPLIRWSDRGAAGDRLVERVSRGEALVASHVDGPTGPLTLVVERSLRGERSASAVVRRTLPLAAAIGLAVATLLGVLLATSLLARLRRLAEAARGLTGERMADPLPVPGGRDEVGELARVMEEMRARLWVEHQARQAFVATASHELRTPLASLGAGLELLEEGLGKPRPSLEAAARRVRTAREQADRLRDLANDLLDLGQLDAGAAVRRDAMGAAEIAELVAGELEPRGDVAVTCQGPCTAQGDPSAYARILRTLLDNALAYGPSGETVELTVRSEGGQVVTTVADAGPGIPPAEREVIFERFERGAASSGTAGFGLGLAIARELAVRMGGSLRLLGDAPSTTFELRLPAATVSQRELHEIATGS